MAKVKFVKADPRLNDYHGTKYEVGKVYDIERGDEVQRWVIRGLAEVVQDAPVPAAKAPEPPKPAEPPKKVENVHQK